MNVKRVETKPLSTNTYIVNDEIIIDPGIGIGKYLEEDKKYNIYLTHAHFDHIAGIEEINYEKIFIHPADVELLKSSEKNLSTFMNKEISHDGDWEDITKQKYEVIHTPGHTPGSCVIIIENYIFTGDTIFEDSIGRTDFPSSSQDDMIESLKKMLKYFLNAPQENIIAPGHMDVVTVKELLEKNPYLR
jgi:glyoxylase-like metal-dependent hydrolase (beta-lactamase superfamily II)